MAQTTNDYARLKNSWELVLCLKSFVLNDLKLFWIMHFMQVMHVKRPIMHVLYERRTHFRAREAQDVIRICIDQRFLGCTNQ